ncbi:MSHA biogenesis protein MshQ [Duganella sp. 1411]|uniref:polymer-forming cytoskeletal protein n=1 Tax=Duganella sp. 1411 TaxID=2806572 RepID=UPI001AE78882|nr:polymer-forming cytoskeletal protein [Duganella sp. 1411]MBP1206264.1 MSHA biogenesis protein MshQ [Duganella sp. 1411]
MTFNFFRLVVLFTTPALRRAGAAAAMAPTLLLAMALLLPADAAQAAVDTFNGGAVAGCTRNNTTYTCATLSQANDITIASGYTVEVAGSVSFAWAQVLRMSGSATLRAGADLDLRGLQTGNTQVAGGTLAAGAAFRLGSNDQTVTADVVAAAVATGGPSTRINGNVTASGLVDLGSNSTITGAVSAGALNTSSNITLGGAVTVTGGVNLGSSTTIAGTLSAATVTANSSLQVNGGIVASGTVSLSSGTTVKGGIAGPNGGSAGAVTTGSGSTISGDIAASAFTLASGSSLTGDIKAPQVELSAANASVTGNITASTSLVVGSGGSVTGKIDSPKVDLNPSGVTIKGDIKADTSLTIGSGNTVNGNISGTSLTIASSNVIVNGNVTMKGDVDIGSGGTINGDLSARNVTTHASGDLINGNAAVNAIFLDWGSAVSKTITCTGPGAVLCSCVTKADPNYQPSCGAAPPSGVHHYHITHNGSALTCQPQTVTVTACANSACTTPNYSGSVTATLQPGGKSFTFTGGQTTSATVEQPSAGTATLSAAGALNASTCFNTADPTSTRPCDMQFDTTGLLVSASDHVSMMPASVTIQALKATPKNPSCVPLVANQKVNVNLSCKFSNPGPAAAANVNVKIDSAALDCRGGPVAVPLTFDANGIATAALQYAEVGEVALNASYAGASLSAAGGGSFIAAPKSFLIEAVSTVTKANTSRLAAGAVFARASEGFTVKVSAVNAEASPKVTTNFGKENTPESITITPARANLDANGNPDPARQNGAISAGKFAPPSDGAYASVIDAAGTGLWSFSDTGAIKLDVTLFNSTGYYMGRVNPAFKTAGTLTVGRFIPDHFDTVLMTNDEIKASVPSTMLEGRSMDCAAVGASTRPCPGSTGSFIHSGQPFFVKVLAYNGAATPAPTLNHTGTYAAAVALSAFTAAGGATATPGGALGWINPAGGGPTSATNFKFDKGVGTLADPAGNLPRFRFSAAYPAQDVLPATFYVRATDADGASSLRASAAASVEAQLTAVSGRLLIANTYGSPNSSMPVDASAQYYMPVGYVFNPLVQLTSGPIAGAIIFDNCLKGLAGRCPSMAAAASPATLTLANGKGKFRLAPPNPVTTTIGSVDVSLGALIYYLPSTIGRATFGIYRSGPVIYRREAY